MGVMAGRSVGVLIGRIGELWESWLEKCGISYRTNWRVVGERSVGVLIGRIGELWESWLREVWEFL